ncbi:MAG: biotin--[acetyl-CoA-carboxylase] ligase [Kordiimonadaceae bacterium]|nr:biotin--[acetyl-CoA-carboxylase] ligase [Kordiimonadaceae bacterium]
MTDQKKMNVPDGFSHQAFMSLDSTNKEAIRQLEAGAKSGLWITAGEQTGGRGRGGRVWVSEPGNLFSSLIYDCGKDIYTAAQLSFVSSLAVRETILEFLPDSDVKCKWPNDVLLEHKKISGILLESHSMGSDTTNHIIIGIGINVAHHPEITSYGSTHLNDHAKKCIMPDDVFYSLAQKMAFWIDIWQNNGFEDIRKKWLNCCKGLNEMITVRTSDQEVAGRFIDLDCDGALKLDTGTHIKLIHSGDVFFTS